MRNPLHKLQVSWTRSFVPWRALKSVTARDGKNIYASSDTLFKGAIFGRDSCTVADDLVEIRPTLTKNILVSLATLQGVENNSITEEEPGKIIHEYRTVMVDDKHIQGIQKEIYHSLKNKWGGNEQQLAYYGSIDATPLFLRSLGNYCSRYGTDILSTPIMQKNGNTITLRESVESATTWLCKKLDSSKSGLLEYLRTNPHGIINQAWKDSDEFYVHENGKPANHSRPIASIEVQGYAYDALLASENLLPDLTENFKHRAKSLRESIIKLLWDNERQYFSVGIDYTDKNKARIIRTASANAGSLLNTKLFDDKSEQNNQRFVASIVKKLMSYDFLSDGGIRSRSLSMGHLIPHWDYHGTFVTWPKETHEIACGFRRHGFENLAKQLENRLINIILKNKSYPEFVYVDGWGRVLEAKPAIHSHGEITLVNSTNSPEHTQAWTVSAIMQTIATRLQARTNKSRPQTQSSWHQKIEDDIMNQIPRINKQLNPIKLQSVYPTYPYKLRED